MRHSKLIAATAAALTIGAATFATSSDADAQWRRHRGNAGAAVAAGVIGGLALGAIASSAAQPRYYDGYGYGAPAYGSPYYGSPSYAEPYETYAEPVYEAPRYAYPYAYGGAGRASTAYNGGRERWYGNSFGGQGGRSRLDSDTPGGR